MRELCKQLARLLATVTMSPVMATYFMRSRLFGANRALEGTSQWLSLLPGLWGCYLRAAFYHFALAECQPTPRIQFGTLLSKAGTRIGPYAYIGPRCHIGLADIGADVLIAAGVQIPGGAHIHGFADPVQPIRNQSGEIRCVKIGAGAWLGAGSIVFADVGQNTVIGAGAVVTRPLPSQVVAVGSPARPVRSRNRDEDVAESPVDIQLQQAEPAFTT